MDSLYTSLDTDQVKVAAHPNIVEMLTVLLYVDALPARLNPRVGVAPVLTAWPYNMCPGVRQEHVTLLGDGRSMI